MVIVVVVPDEGEEEDEEDEEVEVEMEEEGVDEGDVKDDDNVGLLVLDRVLRVVDEYDPL